MKLNIFLSICIMSAINLNICSEHDRRIPNLITYFPFSSNRPTQMFQDIATIHFTAPNEDSSEIHKTVDKIYYLCANQEFEKVQQAEKIFEQIKQPDANAKESDRLDYCTGLVCIGQGYLKDPDTHEKALHHFLEAFRLFNFTGAAHRVGVIFCHKDPQAALYYLLKAHEIGYVGYSSPDDISKRLISLKNPEESLKNIQSVLEFEKNLENY